MDGLKIDRGPENGLEPPRRRRGLWLVVLLVLAAGGWFYQGRPLGVRVATVREQPLGGPRTLLNASGYVTARRQATVSSKTTGKVIEVSLEEGMKVEAGQVLARLDDTNVRASLELAQAQRAAAQAALAETRAQLDRAEKEQRRIENLAATGVATQAALDDTQAEVATFRARLERQQVEITVAEKQVALYRQQVEDHIIRAPFAGMVTTKDAQPGEMISPVSAGGGFTRTGIGTIVDMSSLETEVDVNESFINRVSANQAVEATLDAYADWKIPAHVIAIIPTADRQKSTVKVRVGFEKLDPRILPQMAVKVAFRDSAEGGAPAGKAPAIPKKALQKQDNQDVVYVVDQGRASRRKVTVDSTRPDLVFINEGVRTGEVVVVETPRPLADGQRVRVLAP